MGSGADAAEELLRERAYLALLLLVGAGAVLVGLYQILRSGTSSVSAYFDLALGLCVLLVTWLFLAPSAWPALFGDTRSASRSSRRAYLGAPPAPLVPVARSSAPATPSPRSPAIPRWADPLVQPRIPSPTRPTTALAGTLPVAVIATAPAVEPLDPAPSATSPPPAPTSSRPAPRIPTAVHPVAPKDSNDPFDLPMAMPTDPDDLRSDPWTPDPAGGRPLHSNEMLEELDRIEAELRAFVPGEAPPRSPHPVGVPHLAD